MDIFVLSKYSSISKENETFCIKNKETKQIVDSFANPEDINSSPQTAPSKRLLSIKPAHWQLRLLCWQWQTKGMTPAPWRVWIAGELRKFLIYHMVQR